ncbi:MAG: hypothetical protein ACOX0X_02770 [Candidatus Dojkabacteria bacterium]
MRDKKILLFTISFLLFFLFGILLVEDSVLALSCPDGCFPNNSLGVCTGQGGCVGPVGVPKGPRPDGCHNTEFQVSNYCCDICEDGSGSGCTECTPPACPAGTGETDTGFYATQTSCDRGDGCNPRYNTRTCYYQRQNLCSSAYTSSIYLKSGQSASITANANTNVNTFFYAFYNVDNNYAVVCSANYIAGWAEVQGTCPAGRYQLLRKNYYATARSSETTIFPANSIFINDTNWGGQQVKNLQINTYFIIDGRPTSLPAAPCVFNQRLCSPLCTPSPCLGPIYTYTPTSFGTSTFTCNNSPSACGTESRTCYCRTPCEPPSCPSSLSNTNQGAGISTVTRTCGNACGSPNQRRCYCIDCTPVPSSSAFTLSSTGKQSTTTSLQTVSCSKGEGCTPKTVPQYCVRCTPQSCTPTYSTTNKGFGSVTLSCPNPGEGCGFEGNTCYVDSCSNCTMPNCPTPLTNNPTVDSPNMVLENFRSCTKGSPCGGPPAYASCYEPVSPQPTTSLSIRPDGVNMYGFSSNTHSGQRIVGKYNLNDPIEMEAVYTDPNGANDIEAISVWFRNSSETGEIESPLWIDTSPTPSQAPKAYSNSTWGFMMRLEGTSWRPYVTSYPSGGTAKWVRAIYSNNSFVISGPSGLGMVRVSVAQTDITKSGNSVSMKFTLQFDLGESSESVAEVEYTTYLMGNDLFSFTPYDNYTSYPEVDAKIGDYWAPGQLRYRISPTVAQLYARQWQPTGFNWTVDRVLPDVQDLKISVVGDTTLRLSWQVSDDKKIYAIVGNIYASASMPPDAPPVLLTESGTVLEKESPFTLLPQAEPGVLSSEYAFRKLSIGGTTHTGSIDIDLNGNKEGSLVIYLTVFDMAGNMFIKSLTYSLGDWFVTEGGFVYASEGMNFEVRNIDESTTWSASLLQNFVPSRTDISSEMFADNSSAGTLPSGLQKSTLTGSYHVRPFPVNTKVTSIYTELLRAYNDRAIDGATILDSGITSFTGNLNGTTYGCLASNSVCIQKAPGDLVVGSSSHDFTCDNWGVFFVGGNLTIENAIRNSTADHNKDACIFVVKGDVVINNGPKMSSSTQIEYDEIRAYIVADGNINIVAQTGVANHYDGIFVEGGLHSFSGLNMARSLKLVDRNIYPSLVVKNHPKYSVLSNLVFGSQIDILKTETGFKPY